MHAIELSVVGVALWVAAVTFVPMAVVLFVTGFALRMPMTFKRRLLVSLVGSASVIVVTAVTMWIDGQGSVLAFGVAGVLAAPALFGSARLLGRATPGHAAVYALVSVALVFTAALWLWLT